MKNSEDDSKTKWWINNHANDISKNMSFLSGVVLNHILQEKSKEKKIITKINKLQQILYLLRNIRVLRGIVTN